MVSAGSAAASVSAQKKKLEKRYIEGLRKEVFELIGLGLPAGVDQDDWNIAAEFPEDLAAGAAGRREGVGVGGDGDAAEFADALADGLKHGDALCTNRETVRGVLHVAAGVYAAGIVFQRR